MAKSREEKQAYQRAYREANREKRLEASKAYYWANRERVLERQKPAAKAYRAANKEKIREQQKAWVERNPEKVREWSRRHNQTAKRKISWLAWQERNKEEEKERLRLSYLAAKERADEEWLERRRAANRRYHARHAAARNAGRKARKKANPEQTAIQTRAYNQRRRQWRYGSEPRTILPRDWERLVNRHGGLCAYCQNAPWSEQDHVIPLARGGRHTIGNVLPACGPCNHQKNARLLIEWRVRWTVMYQ